MRLFIAILFEQQMVDALTEYQKNLRKISAVGNYTKEENLHLTLAFVGEYGNPDEVLDALEQVEFRPFEIRLDGVGHFGDLLWAGVTGEDKLAAVAKRLRHALAEAGIPFDKKKFRPHVTLIRKVSFRTEQKLPAEPLRAAGMTVKRISLMKSERGKNGMVYTEIGAVECTTETWPYTGAE